MHAALLYRPQKHQHLVTIRFVTTGDSFDRRGQLVPIAG